jgi:hypothetical protein
MSGKTKRIVLDTSSSNSDFDGDCDYAVVELTPELVDRIRRRVKLARQAGRQDNDLWEMYFWDGAAEFYDCGLVDACQQAFAADQAAQEWLTALGRDGHALVPPTANLTACQPQRTECDQMIVRAGPSSVAPEYVITWVVIPKHCDVYVTTRDLPLAALEGYLADRQA